MPKHLRTSVFVKGTCYHCGKPLRPIGYSREKGKPHNDWASRTLHKKCWKVLKQEGTI